MTDYTPGGTKIRRVDVDVPLPPDEQALVDQDADKPSKDLPAIQTSGHKPMFNRKLSRGYKKLQLLRELAIGEKTQRQLAAEYEVTQGSIWQFRKKHAEEINAIRQNMDDEFAGIWLANKVNRIVEYVTDIEEINSLEVLDATLLARKQAALKAIAEERGQLQQRIQVDADVKAKVTYEVVGTDVENLK